VLPDDGPALVDWYQFESVVQPMLRAAHRFSVVLPVPAGGTAEQHRARMEQARRVVELEKPAHTVFDVRFYWAMFRVGEARLGVEDFTQEHAYLSERDRWLARDLLGYGTAWGLSVTTQVGTRGPEVRVSPGVALSPRGQLIRVTPAQCAALDAWLASQGTQVD